MPLIMFAAKWVFHLIWKNYGEHLRVYFSLPVRSAGKKDPGAIYCSAG